MFRQELYGSISIAVVSMVLTSMQTQLLNTKKSCNKVNLNIYNGKFWPNGLQNLVSRKKVFSYFVGA